uniref:WW domain binding protein 1-like isoform X1 n=1 Tax=Myxine glutinosa TaxID=7769 RepID=UPI00358F73D3
MDTALVCVVLGLIAALPGAGRFLNIGGLASARKLCSGADSKQYWCDTGHCCGEAGCCTYYYELWWFWLVWSLIILLSCCCAYYHRRVKLRSQQQQRQREINLLAYEGACNYPGPPLDIRLMATCKLPAYEEVLLMRPRNTPPPPYSSLHQHVLQGRAALSDGLVPTSLAACTHSSSLSATTCSSSSAQSLRDGATQDLQAASQCPVEVCTPSPAFLETRGSTDSHNIHSSPSEENQSIVVSVGTPTEFENGGGTADCLPQANIFQDERNGELRPSSNGGKSSLASLCGEVNEAAEAAKTFEALSACSHSDGEDGEGGSFRQRLFTRDSGIDVCMCSLQRDGRLHGHSESSAET